MVLSSRTMNKLLILLLTFSPTQGWPSPKHQAFEWPTVQSFRLSRPTRPVLDLALPDRTVSVQTSGTEQVTVTATRRAATIKSPDLTDDTARSLWNVGGNPMQPQADCQQNYTTVAGQPAHASDFVGPKGVRDCWF